MEKTKKKQQPPTPPTVSGFNPSPSSTLLLSGRTSIGFDFAVAQTGIGLVPHWMIYKLSLLCVLIIIILVFDIPDRV